MGVVVFDPIKPNECDPEPPVRTFATGATRSADATRDDPEGYLSPLVIDRFNEYMTRHRVQPNKQVRDSDNWQKGMPLETYMKGAWRHLLHWWTRHRGWQVRDPKAAANIEEDLCALLFNVQGYLHEILSAKQHSSSDKPDVVVYGVANGQVVSVPTVVVVHDREK